MESIRKKMVSTGTDATDSQDIYAPLDRSADDIRILKVLPDLSDGKIQISMRKERMPATYRCLSYRWGDPPNECEVLVNGHSVTVRKNLYDFLQTARERFHSTPLWVDALCINQSNNAEKNHQVQRMGKIYRNAEAVLIWLGMEPELDEFLEEGNIGSLCENPPYWIHVNSPFHEEIYHLMCNEYWSRLWIVQEVLLAKESFLVNGRRIVPWSSLDRIIDWHLPEAFHGGRCSSELCMMREIFRGRPCRHHETECRHEELKCRHPESREYHSKRHLGIKMDLIAIQRNRWLGLSWEKDRSSLWDHLAISSSAKCSDIRDRVYGLLSLFDLHSTLRVDYEENVCSLFWRAITHFKPNKEYAASVLRTALHIGYAEVLAIDNPEEVKYNTVALNICRILQASKGSKKKHCLNVGQRSRHPHQCAASAIELPKDANDVLVFCLDDTILGTHELHAIRYQFEGRGDYTVELVFPSKTNHSSGCLPLRLRIPSFESGGLYRTKNSPSSEDSDTRDWKPMQKALRIKTAQWYDYAVGVEVDWLIHEVAHYRRRVEVEVEGRESDDK